MSSVIMKKVHYATSLNEALDMAKGFCIEKKYDLFRGQAQNWKVVSSLSRLNDPDAKEAKEKAGKGGNK